MNHKISFLLPIGSSNERIKGISHFFEHILITKIQFFHRNAGIIGYTTEDYVILFCSHLNFEKFINTLERFKLEPYELKWHKEILIREIEKKRFEKEEEFFRLVWGNTNYENSPLGNIDEIKTITVKDIDNLNSQVQKTVIFYFSRGTGLKTFNKTGVGEKILDLNIHLCKSLTYRNKSYNIIYFNGQLEKMILLSKIIRDLNKTKHIQLIEKKALNAFIIEKGTCLPDAYNIADLRESAIKGIENEIKEINRNFNERALNELESIYFYGESWSERISNLFKTSDEQLLKIVKILDRYFSPT